MRLASVASVAQVNSQPKLLHTVTYEDIHELFTKLHDLLRYLVIIYYRLSSRVLIPILTP